MEFTRNNNILIVHLEDVINFSNATEMKNTIRNELKETDQDLVLDLRLLEFADSSGVGMMVSLLKTMSTKGGLIRICSPTEEMKFVLKMTKIDIIIPVFKTLEEAIKSIETENEMG